ncbi:hypothetical protein [Candidatus Chloroploca sp. Khr17]|uniref:hypothetical protein n=1 Tax=Candidatus Chloroploca sp. Khr17 TaxID=2496869 RepID=UPI00101C832C|nr:hypothetical protein [Candidatus Chloroploca sp. Khr17]
MLTAHVRRMFMIGMTLTIGLILVISSYRAFASAAQIAVFTPQGSAFCARTGGSAPAVFQGQTFLTRFDYFRVLAPPFGPEPVTVDITFPDGRVFTIPASQQLDGVIDLPNNFPPASRFVSNGAGQFSLTIPVPGTWPYGCYTVSGRGLSSGGINNATAFFVVAPGGQPGPAGNANLRVTRNGQDIAAAFQGEIVEVDGRGFIGGEFVSLWITAPDGTVIDFPPGQQVVQATPAGALSTSFQFEGKNPTGRYTFTALGQQSQFRVFASFELRAPPVVERGPAQLYVVVPADMSGPQRSVFYANGDLFFPGERVDLWLTFPDGAVRGFPSTFADPIAGQFLVELALDERLPVGFYQLTAQGAESRQLIIAGFNLEQNFGTVFNPYVSPEIGLDNDPRTRVDLDFIDPDPYNWNEYGNPDE